MISSIHCGNVKKIIYPVLDYISVVLAIGRTTRPFFFDVPSHLPLIILFIFLRASFSPFLYVVSNILQYMFSWRLLHKKLGVLD